MPDAPEISRQFPPSLLGKPPAPCGCILASARPCQTSATDCHQNACVLLGNSEATEIYPVNSTLSVKLAASGCLTSVNLSVLTMRGSRADVRDHLRVSWAGEQKEPKFLELHPNGRISAIAEHFNGFVLWESCAILLYIMDKYDKEGNLEFRDPSGYYRQLQ
ncbi:hypothetical protein NEOLEDRAFT_557551 [Neolentinus lepideus HHB14362 ss-1]|uniref:GST N-terminal domain-containing protein n=1 Tax=Neolentinus lepideus HHB14362 ss-1 TaxID=1314782 RepID=A0A165R5J5_9AGAM|nr:hypothetical protein NEOLEDRAFT_557551 [Neolentinus lepideus HHB14362 ss-1]